MKMTIFKIAAAFMIAGSIASCTGNNKGESTTETDPATVSYDANGVPIDSLSTTSGAVDGSVNSDEGNSNNSNSVTSNRTETTPNNKNSASETSNTKKDGYSAPDGTDAENSDGDYYTRNDKTPMPSGTPIK